MPNVAVGEWPLVGRAVELDALASAVTSAESVLLAGPPGVGKTRLATETMGLAAARGFKVLRVSGSQAASRLPFGAFAFLLPELDAAAEGTSTLRELARAVIGQGPGGRLALLVDDAHLLDPSSAVLVHELAAAESVFVVAVVRSRACAPDPIQALWKDGLATRIEIDQFGETEVGQVLEATLGGPVHGATRHLLFERTLGNVLFLRELVEGALNAGVLGEKDGLWQLTGPLPVTARLVELIDARIDGLPGPERAVVDTLAVGEPLALRLLERVVSPEAVRSLDERRLLQIAAGDDDVQVRLIHPLFGDVVRDGLPALRTRQICRDLADALDALGVGEDLLRLASWRLQAGDGAHAATMSAGAEQAWRLGDLPQAERLATAASRAGAGFDTQLLLAQVYAVSGREKLAEQRYADLAQRADTDDGRMRLAVPRIDNLCHNLGSLDAALRVAQEAEQAISDQRRRDDLIGYRASLLDAAGRTTEALAVILPVLDRAGSSVGIWARVMGSFILARVGQLERASRLVDPAPEETRVTDSPWGTAPLPVLRSWALLFAGDLDAAEDLADREYERGLTEGSTETEFLLGLVRALIELARGRPNRAARWANESVSLLRGHGRLIQLRAALIALAEAQALRGEPHTAKQTLEEVSALPITVRLMESELLRVRGWVALAEGDDSLATGLFTDAAGVAATAGDLVWEAAALHDLARAGSAPAALHRLSELAGLIEGKLAPLRARHCAAMAESDPEALIDCSEAFENLGMHLLAAEAAQQAAVALRRDGEPRRATALDRRSEQLLSRCDQVVSPTLKTTTSARATLSARELEIAGLAIDGLSSKDIAAKLHLSHRYVEKKLSETYEKLGVAGRGELRVAISSLALSH